MSTVPHKTRQGIEGGRERGGKGEEEMAEGILLRSSVEPPFSREEEEGGGQRHAFCITHQARKWALKLKEKRRRRRRGAKCLLQKVSV